MYICTCLQTDVRGRTKVVEVKKDDRGKIWRYSELKGDQLIYTLQFLKFESVEPDSSVFKVPAVCGQRLFYRY